MLLKSGILFEVQMTNVSCFTHVICFTLNSCGKNRRQDQDIRRCSLTHCKSASEAAASLSEEASISTNWSFSIGLNCCSSPRAQLTYAKAVREVINFIPLALALITAIYNEIKMKYVRQAYINVLIN